MKVVCVLQQMFRCVILQETVGLVVKIIIGLVVGPFDTQKDALCS
jgi:hypothetical protein